MAAYHRGWLIVTCGLTACTPGSAPGPMLGSEYGRTLHFYYMFCIMKPISRNRLYQVLHQTSSWQICDDELSENLRPLTFCQLNSCSCFHLLLYRIITSLRYTSLSLLFWTPPTRTTHTQSRCKPMYRGLSERDSCRDSIVLWAVIIVPVPPPLWNVLCIRLPYVM